MKRFLLVLSTIAVGAALFATPTIAHSSKTAVTPQAVTFEATTTPTRETTTAPVVLYKVPKLINKKVGSRYGKFNIKVKSTRITNNKNTAGRVYWQSVKPGKMLLKGATIRVCIYKYVSNKSYIRARLIYWGKRLKIKNYMYWVNLGMRITHKESHWNPAANNGSFHGIFQMNLKFGSHSKLHTIDGACYLFMRTVKNGGRSTVFSQWAQTVGHSCSACR